MKIALVIKDFVESHGGLERYTVSLARGLSERGNEVHVFANRWDDEPGMVFHYVPFVRWNSILREMTFPSNARKHVAKGSFDVVYGLSPFYPLDVYRVGQGLHADLLRLRCPNPIKRFLKLLNPKHRLILSTERALFSPDNHRKIITNSLMVKERAVELYGINPNRVAVVYNGCDHKKFNPDVKRFRREVRSELGITDDEPVLLFASNDFQRKGLGYLIEALTILKKDDHAPKLVVVGKGREARLRSLVNKEGLSDLVRFVGHVTDIERYYGAADIFVLPTIYDPFSNACLEALACGLPVITTRTNGASEIITNGKDGFVIDSGRNTHLLADRIFSLLSIEDAGEAAARTASAYTLERNVSETLDHLSELVDNRKVVPLRAGLR